MVINCVSSPFGCFTSLARFCPGRRFCDNERRNTDEVRTTFTGFQSSSKILVSQKCFLMLCLTLPFLTIYFLNKMLHKNRNRMKNSPFLQEYCKGTTKRTNTKIILIKETASNFIPVFARKLEKKEWLTAQEYIRLQQLLRALLMFSCVASISITPLKFLHPHSNLHIVIPWQKKSGPFQFTYQTNYWKSLFTKMNK